jgi:glycerol-3-phosphate dehydrogenase subunit B
MPRADVVVIGAGLAGLSCAAELTRSGASVFLAAKGMAATHWAHGGLDVACVPGARTSRDGVRALATAAGHPYAALAGDVEAAVDAHLTRLAAAGLPMRGSIDGPLVPIPTAIGGLRPAAILPAGQGAALDSWEHDGLLLVGIRGYRDAWPRFAARNLVASGWIDGPRAIRGIEVELPDVDRLRNLNARSLARLFEDPAWRAPALESIARAIPAGPWRVALPAVLGISDHAAVHAEAEAIVGRPLIEMPALPPSVPGMRLFDALREAVIGAGGRVQVGFDVVEVERQGRRIAAVHTEAASRTLRLAADEFVLATGGIGGEGIRAHPDGSLVERVFGLIVAAPPREGWFSDDHLVPHPIEAAGILTDASLRPLDADGVVALDNVRVIGSALAGMHYLEQRCGDGVALASAHAVARSLAIGRAAA